MKRKRFLVSSSFCIAIMLIGGCTNPTTSRGVPSSSVSVPDTLDETPPPPTTLSCTNATSLKDWFVSIANTHKPNKAPVSYTFALFETANCYAVYLRESGQAHNDHFTGTIVDSGRTDYYRAINSADYKGLAWKERLGKIRSQLREYAKEKEIQTSPLWQATKIDIVFDDLTTLNLK